MTNEAGMEFDQVSETAKLKAALGKAEKALEYYKRLHSQHNDDDEIEPDEDGGPAWEALKEIKEVLG